MSNPSMHSVAIAQVAADYKNRGYEVEIEPSKVPPFLAPYRPDAIARGPNENVVIEVKVGASRTSVAESLRELAEKVHAQKGWRLAVVFVDSSGSLRMEETPLRDVRQLRGLIERSESLKAAGQVDAAFLLLWSALEASLRTVTKRAHIPLSTMPTMSLVRELYSAGELSRDTYLSIQRLTAVRNSLAHGFEVDVTDADFSELAETAKHLVNEINTLNRSRGPQ